MEIKIGDSPIQNLDSISYTIVFKDDAERMWLVNLLTNMEPKEGAIAFCHYENGGGADGHLYTALSESAYTK